LADPRTVQGREERAQKTAPQGLNTRPTGRKTSHERRIIFRRARESGRLDRLERDPQKNHRPARGKERCRLRATPSDEPTYLQRISFSILNETDVIVPGIEELGDVRDGCRQPEDLWNEMAESNSKHKYGRRALRLLFQTGKEGKNRNEAGVCPDEV